jgi:hypothetical protein
MSTFKCWVMDDRKIIELLQSSDLDECRLGLELYAQLEHKGGLFMTMAVNKAQATIDSKTLSMIDRMKKTGMIPLDKGCYPRSEITIVTGTKGHKYMSDMFNKKFEEWKKDKR